MLFHPCRAQKLFPNFIAALKADGGSFKEKERDLVNVSLYRHFQLYCNRVALHMGSCLAVSSATYCRTAVSNSGSASAVTAGD
jgi:hypothetical protein